MLNWLKRLPEAPVSARVIPPICLLVVLYIISAALTIFAPGTQSFVLKVLLMAGSFLFGALWAYAKLPWFLSWVAPAGFFTLFAFLRLDGLPALVLLIGYILLALGGALLIATVRRYKQPQ